MNLRALLEYSDFLCLETYIFHLQAVLGCQRPFALNEKLPVQVRDGPS